MIEEPWLYPHQINQKSQADSLFSINHTEKNMDLFTGMKIMGYNSAPLVGPGSDITSDNLAFLIARNI